MLIFIALGKVHTSGPVIVTTEEHGTNWSVLWLNKMTNAVTKITRLNPNEYVIENTTPRTPTVTYEHTITKEACLTFFINADTERLSEEHIKKARKEVIDFIKSVEKLSKLELNLKDSSRNRQRKALNKPVLIGKNKELKGIMLGLNWAATQAKVAILGESGLPIRIVEMPTTLVWLP